MLRSLFAGVSGLRVHQSMMDVVGNNIANVNTTGYKSSQAIFEDTLSQMIRAAGAPQGAGGGSNPAQVGLGVRLGGIQTNFAQGAIQLTGRTTDLAIQGDGFFAVRHGGETLYTRSGSFSFDANGTLVTADGDVVRGWSATNGAIDTNASVTDLRLPLGTLLSPTRTSSITLGGNLPAEATPYVPASGGTAASGTKIVSSITCFDSQGSEYPVTFEMTKDAAAGDDATHNYWTVVAKDANGQVLTATPSPKISFNPTTGAFSSDSATQLALTPVGPAWGGRTISVDLKGITEYGGANTVGPVRQDGATMGSLQSFTISQDGTLVGVFSNGLKQALGQIAIATFSNPPGLEKAGGSLYRSTVNSGQPQNGVAGNAGRGTLSSGSLEMSNVDLANEFSNLIVAQRGFQANARVITSSDEILQDLVQLKR